MVIVIENSPLKETVGDFPVEKAGHTSLCLAVKLVR